MLCKLGPLRLTHDLLSHYHEQYHHHHYGLGNGGQSVWLKNIWNRVIFIIINIIIIIIVLLVLMGDRAADSWPYMTPLLMVGGGTCRKIPNLAWLHRAILNYGILCHPISFIPCPKFFSSTILNYGILCHPISFIPRPKFFFFSGAKPNPGLHFFDN